MYDEIKDEWYFQVKKNSRFDINITSEGVKKIAILDVLLGNHYLTKNSIIFIDEPESNLHPELISYFMECISMLVEEGLQFFICSHSYYVIKKLYIMAHKKKMSIPVFSFGDGGVQMSDLKRDMPDNPIIEETVNLYKQEISL